MVTVLLLGFKPLHDIGKHIENLFCELPDHLPTDEASKFWYNQQLNTALLYGTHTQPRTSDRWRWFREEQLDGSSPVTVVRILLLSC
jgi:hypothetical protein